MKDSRSRIKSPSRLVRPAEILLVEDNAGDVRLAIEALKDAKVHNNLTTVSDGASAMALLRRQGQYAKAPRPDLILLDLNLPGLDGYGVLSHLRSRPATSKIPVVVLTARGDEDNEVRVLELGADDFLSKPFRARALSARLKTILGRRYGKATH